MYKTKPPIMLRRAWDKIRHPHGILKIADEENLEDVSRDPRFGLCRLTQYACRTKGTSCTEQCSLGPVCIIVLQWLFFIVVLVQEKNTPWCPKGTARIMYAGIAMLYFTRVANLWDDFVDRCDTCKRAKPSWASLFDTIHEHTLGVAVPAVNLVLILRAEPLDMLLNSVALDFIHELDNLYLEAYMRNVPEAREHIYKDFVNQEGVEETLQKASAGFRAAYACTGCILGALRLCVLALYPFTLGALYYSVTCI
jgi:hypothetical protein